MAIVELAEPFEFGQRTKIYPACLYGKDGYAPDLRYAGYGSTYIRIETKLGHFTVAPKKSLPPFSAEGHDEIRLETLEKTGLFHLKMTELKKNSFHVNWLADLLFPPKIIMTSSEHSSVCYGDSGKFD